MDPYFFVVFQFTLIYEANLTHLQYFNCPKPAVFVWPSWVQVPLHVIFLTVNRI